MKTINSICETILWTTYQYNSINMKIYSHVLHVYTACC